MKYEKIVCGQFVSRPNRFVAQVIVDGKEEKVHVKNTGRCKELLVPKCKVYLEDFNGRMGNRKMRYSLVAVEKAGKLINMDSQAPNKVVYEAFTDKRISLSNMDELTCIKPEKTYKDSRFDLYLEDIYGKKAFVEVKGVTLEEDGLCRFPDAPTLRGLKHIKELCQAKEEGYEAAIIFVIQMEEASLFGPNYDTQSEFGLALKEAKAKGVEIYAYNCKVDIDSLEIFDKINIDLDY
ncbi:MAG: DNA/RNA nuclease SfsA [Clostridia bacterium]|nr:DNA/RNA nuclease SfsA [Clostridia bacterium]